MVLWDIMKAFEQVRYLLLMACGRAEGYPLSHLRMNLSSDGA